MGLCLYMCREQDLNHRDRVMQLMKQALILNICPISFPNLEIKLLKAFWQFLTESETLL